MLIKISEFRERIRTDMDQLVIDLQSLTHRYGHAEEQAWRSSLPKVSDAFSAPSFGNLDLYFGGKGSLALEYKMPAAPSWADMVLLGKHLNKPAAVIVELKDWITQGDLPGPREGLMERHGQTQLHPSDQVRGYTEYCRSFHSTVQEYNATVHGCVVFTKDPYYHTYSLAPNDLLTRQYPCFSVDKDDVATRLPEFFKDRLSEPDQEFARKFEAGVYKQSRGFVRQIGEQILNREASPFVLLDNQRKAFSVVMERVAKAVLTKRPKKTVILIEGPPGSGKSVVAAKVWASLVTDKNLPRGNVVLTTTSASQNSNWRYLFDQASGMSGAKGAVVAATSYTPLSTQQFGKLREKYPDAFQKEPKWRENLKMLRSLDPNFRSGSRDNEFLVSIVDEAHSLINPEHIEGRGQFGFTTAVGPQAFHIMRASTVSIFLLDTEQGFRDRENTSMADLKDWAKELGTELFEQIDLSGSQFRCAGSNEYFEWVNRLLGFKTDTKPARNAFVLLDGTATYEGMPETAPMSLAAEEAPAYLSEKITKTARFTPFEMELFDTLPELENALRKQVRQKHTVRLLASYSRKWKTEGVAMPHQSPAHLMDFHEPCDLNDKHRFWSKIWNYVPKGGSDYTHYIHAPEGSKMHLDPLSEVGCPYAVRGFDFDYVGVLWLSDLKWRNGRWIVDENHVFERGISRKKSAAKKEKDPDGPEHSALLRAVASAYRILLTRPMKGLYVWCEDAETRTHIESKLSTPA